MNIKKFQKPYKLPIFSRFGEKIGETNSKNQRYTGYRIQNNKDWKRRPKLHYPKTNI